MTTGERKRQRARSSAGNNRIYQNIPHGSPRSQNHSTRAVPEMASDIEHMLSSHEPQVAVPPGFRPLISGLIKKQRLRLLVKREKKIKVFISYTDLLTQLFFVGHSDTQMHRCTDARTSTPENEHDLFEEQEQKTKIYESCDGFALIYTCDSGYESTSYLYTSSHRMKFTC